MDSPEKILPVCVLCKTRSHKLFSETTPEEVNANIIEGKMVFYADETGQGVCFLCAHKVVHIHACATQWLMPGNTNASAQRLRMLIQRLYSQEKVAYNIDLFRLYEVVSNLSRTEEAMDREEARQKTSARHSAQEVGGQ